MTHQGTRIWSVTAEPVGQSQMAEPEVVAVSPVHWMAGTPSQTNWFDHCVPCSSSVRPQKARDSQTFEVVFIYLLQHFTVNYLCFEKELGFTATSVSVFDDEVAPQTLAFPKGST